VLLGGAPVLNFTIFVSSKPAAAHSIGLRPCIVRTLFAVSTASLSQIFSKLSATLKKFSSSQFSFRSSSSISTRKLSNVCADFSTALWRRDAISSVKSGSARASVTSDDVSFAISTCALIRFIQSSCFIFSSLIFVAPLCNTADQLEKVRSNIHLNNQSLRPVPKNGDTYPFPDLGKMGTGTIIGQVRCVRTNGNWCLSPFNSVPVNLAR
jgi:hypothetical protein